LESRHLHTEFDSEEEQEVKSILEVCTNAETMDLAQSVSGRNKTALNCRHTS